MGRGVVAAGGAAGAAVAGASGVGTGRIGGTLGCRARKPREPCMAAAPTMGGRGMGDRLQGRPLRTCRGQHI